MYKDSGTGGAKKAVWTRERVIDEVGQVYVGPDNGGSCSLDKVFGFFS